MILRGDGKTDWAAYARLDKELPAWWEYLREAYGPCMLPPPLHKYCTKCNKKE